MVQPLVAAMVIVAGAASQAPERQEHALVVFDTEKGTIEVEVDAVRAPTTSANFLKYVDAGFFDGGSVNRAVRPDNTVRHDVEIQVIQFQIDAARSQAQFPPIPLERTSVTGLKHVDGAISMARNGPDTATASFSIVIGDQPEMDFGGRRQPDGQGFAVRSRRWRNGRGQGDPGVAHGSGRSLWNRVALAAHQDLEGVPPEVGSGSTL